jgi:hypothetical protein
VLRALPGCNVEHSLPPQTPVNCHSTHPPPHSAPCPVISINCSDLWRQEAPPTGSKISRCTRRHRLASFAVNFIPSLMSRRHSSWRVLNGALRHQTRISIIMKVIMAIQSKQLWLSKTQWMNGKDGTCRHTPTVCWYSSYIPESWRWGSTCQPSGVWCMDPLGHFGTSSESTTRWLDRVKWYECMYCE